MNESIALAAEGLVGVPFLHQGRDPCAGLDCVGVVYAACLRAGAPIEDFRHYDRMPAPEQLGAELGKRFRAVSIENMQRGDIVVIRGRRESRHVGVVTRDGHMIEARDGRRTAESRFLPASVAAVYRMRGR